MEGRTEHLDYVPIPGIDVPGYVSPGDIAGVPDDTKYLGDILDRLYDKLCELVEATIRREEPAPGKVELPYSAQSNKLRALYLVVTMSAAGTVALRFGTATRTPLNFPAADTKVIPLMETIDSGIDVTLVATGGSADGYIIGYPE